MNELETFIGPNNRPTQIFNGKVYQLYDSDPRYFCECSKGARNRLHVVVWTYYHGKPPKKHHVHHKDENKYNNHIDNLELKKASSHISDHMQKWANKDPQYFKNLAKSGQDAAAMWSKTPEGYEFRKNQAKAVLGKYVEINMRTKVEKQCDNCGSKYEVIKILSQSSRFCCNNCKSDWRRKKGLDNISSTCVVCGNEFTKNKYVKTITCSKSCGCKMGANPQKYRR